jgi:hypothetical protein
MMQMATKKKAKKAKSKPKAKKKKGKKPAKRGAARKPAARKRVAKKKTKAKAAKPKSKPKSKPKPRRAVGMKVSPAKPAAPAGEERIGIVTHYFSHLMVATVALETGVLRTGDTIHIKGHTSDFRQVIESMELNHVHVDEVRALQSFGLRVKEHAREHDIVYKAKA